ncbi:MAG TPA: hypothetical protein VHO23_00615 [Candidatus Paceibacterota bacterium]|nr:hypothetical protein [Candidatus Paceibacterota bacterium]
MAPNDSSNFDQEPTSRDIMAILRTMQEWMHGMSVQLATFERNQNKMTNALADIQDDLTSALAAVDKDSIVIIDHERRLKKLERV